MDDNNNTMERRMGNDGAPSLSLLLEAVGKRPGALSVTTEQQQVGGMAEGPYGATPVGPVSDVPDTAVDVSKQDAAGDEVGKNTVVSSSAGESSGSSLEVLASAAQVGACDVEPPLPAAAAPPATSKMTSDATPSREEIKKQRSALLKAAKSLSSDPLVQLSILRAMQQQRVPPDVVTKNKEEREKAAEARQQRLPKKRKAVVAAPAPLPKKPKVRVEDRAPKRAPDVCSVASTSGEGAASFRSAITPAPQQAPGSTQPKGPSLEALLRVLSQQQQAPAPNPTPAADPNVLSGTLDFVQSLLRAVQRNQTQPQVANMPPFQAASSSDAGNVMDLFRSLGSGVPPHQQVAMAQVLLPFLSNLNSAQNNNNYPGGHNSGTSARDSSLSSSQKDSDESKQQTKSGAPVGQEVRIPCRARGMPSGHNFQAAHFIIPKDIKHGQDLVCSFPECRAGGVKFRYCLFCRIPVAKRNFRLRHSHVDTSSQPPGPDDMKVPSTICVAMDSSRASGLPDSREVAARAQVDKQYFQEEEGGRHGKKHKRQLSDGHHHRHDKESSKKHRRHEKGERPLGLMDLSAPKKDHKSDRDKKKHKKKHSSKRHRSSSPHVAAVPTKHDHGGINFVDDISHQKKSTKRTGAKPDALKNIGEKRLYMWASLLGQRPSKDDEDNMSKWLMSVLAVSDPKAPLKDDMSSSPSSLSLEGFDSSEQKQSAGELAAAGAGGSDSSD